MPYIKEERRDVLEQNLEIPEMEHCGELNYVLTVAALEYLDQHGLRYQTLNDISGAFTEALAEFRRRVVVDYENEKIEDNGDVYLSTMDIFSSGSILVETNNASVV